MRGKVLISDVLPKFESVLSQGTTQKDLHSLLQVFIQMDQIPPSLLQVDHPRSLSLSLYQTFNHLHALYCSCAVSTCLVTETPEMDPSNGSAGVKFSKIPSRSLIRNLGQDPK